MPPQDQDALAQARAESIRLMKELEQLQGQQQSKQAQAMGATTAGGAEIVKTIPEKNGIVYRYPDGKLVYTEMGPGGGVTYSSNDPAEIQRIIQGEAPGQARRTTQQQELIEQEPVRAAALTAAQGIPFGIGQSIDELMGQLSGDPRYTAAIRAYQQAMAEQKPAETLGLQVGMGAVSSLPLVPFQVMGAASPLTTALTAGGVGAAEGALSGFAAGEGTAEERLGGAGMGALVGGVAAPVLTLGAQPVRVGVENLFKSFQSKPIAQMAKDLGISKDAARTVLNLLNLNDIPAAQAALDRAGSRSMLAEINQDAKDLLDYMINVGSGGDRAKAALRARTIESDQQMKGAFDRFLGAPKDIEDVTAGIRGASAQARDAAYKAAYGMPLNYDSLDGAQLQNFLKFVPKQAIAYANKLINMDPRSNTLPIVLEEAPLPSPLTASQFQLPGSNRAGFTNRLTTEQWDYITRGLNEMAYASAPAGAMGGKSQIQAQAASNAREIRKLLMDLNPEYRKALGLARDTIEEVNAAEIGYNLLNPSTTVKEITETLSDPSPAVRQAMKDGLRSNLDQTLGNLRVSAANPDTEPAELNAAIKALTSRNNKSKITALLGQAEADDFYKIVDEQATTVRLQSAVAKNSATALRTKVGEAFKEAGGENTLIGQIARGKIPNAFEVTVQALTGKTAAADLARNMGLADDIASLLTRVQGQQAKDALTLINKVKQGMALTTDQAKIVAKAITSPAAMAAYTAITSGMRQSQIQPRRGREATE